jgi:hypothetical protein
MIRKLLAAALAARKSDDEPLILGEAARGISRRALLLGLAAMPVAAHALPKLWVPGARTISLPPRTPFIPIGLADFYVPEFDFEDLAVELKHDVQVMEGLGGTLVTIARDRSRLEAVGTLDPIQAAALLNRNAAATIQYPAEFLKIRGPVFRDVLWRVESVAAEPLRAYWDQRAYHSEYRYRVKMHAVEK